MLKVFLLGHTYAHSGQRPVHLSTKAVALITYLVLEERVHHRDHMAALLWNHGDARQNLRVELARIRSAGIVGFPLGERLLTVHNSTTDLGVWEDGLKVCAEFSDDQVQTWLSGIRGIPLSGLDDLGGPEFRMWVDHQRQLIINRLAEGLEQAYRIYGRQRRAMAVGMVNARLQLLGCAALPPLPEHSDEVQFDRVETERLREIMRRAARSPQVLVLRGETGSGKSYEVRRLAQEAQALEIHCDAQSLHLSLAIIAQRIRPHLPDAVAERLAAAQGQVAPQGQVVAVAGALTHLTVPVVLDFDQAERASLELAGFIQLLVNTDTRALCVLSCREAEYAAGGKLIQQLRRVLPEDRSHLVQLGPLSVASVTDALKQLDPLQAPEVLEVQAVQLMQRTGGSPLLLREALSEDFPALTIHTRMDERLDSEIDSWPEDVRHGLEALSLLLTPVDQALVAELQVVPAEDATRFLTQAHACGALCEHRQGGVVVLQAGLRVEGHQAAVDSLFRDEHLRVRLASRLAAPRRVEMNRRLAQVFAPRHAGLARFYALRAGLTPPPDVPGVPGVPGPVISSVMRAPPPLPHVEPPAPNSTDQPPVTAEGYVLTVDRGWLRVLRRGRYGPAQTLTLRVPGAADEGGARTLSLIWRLDRFTGGFQFDPQEVPFPLGVWPGGPATVFTPYDQPDFEECGVPVGVRREVTVGRWMHHTLTVPVKPAAPWIELRFRSLDLILTVAGLSVGGRQVLPLTSGRAVNAGVQLR
ncbi:ATP-binding protein [Deinococcus radiotolerans]|uniref:Uncharacterized protein n=1 Tax=Deinococcus radiotolerans TaxID=1309407 RepID=A0ABQ2FLE5_9DEIO|nr:ATP-binding protein [Deinococcus radiotolerans]GGL09670.1 hypothetical protein GCM10010844_30450 [Deinococcus radiotolerans]